MSISPLIFNGTPGAVSTDDTNKVSLRKLTTDPLTHDDLDDNFQSISEKINEIIAGSGSLADLTVEGNLVIDHSGVRGIWLGDTAGAGVKGYVGGGTYAVNGLDQGDFGISSAAGKSLAFGTGGTERARIDSTGKVGIGTGTTTNLGATLEVQATDDSAGAYAFWVISKNHQNSIITAFENGDVQLGGFFYDDSTGNVGIGTTPDTTLRVQNSGGSNSYALQVLGNNTDKNRIGGIMDTHVASTDRSAGALVLHESNTTSGVFLTAYPDSDSYINNGGNVGIGTSSPSARLSLPTNGGDHTGTTNQETIASSADGISLGDDANSYGFNLWHDHAGISGGSPGQTVTYFDSVYDHDDSLIIFRTKTAGTAVDALTIKGDGDVVLSGKISGDGSLLTNLPSSGAPSGDFTGTLRGLTGAHIAPTSGKGIEIFHNNHAGVDKGYVFAYDRDTTAYGDIQLGGSQNGGVTVLGSNGNVGIGTDQPISVLEVEGRQNWAVSASNLAESVTKSALRVRGSSDSSDSLFFGTSTTSANPYIQATNDAGTNAGKNMLLQPWGGNVGIGFDAPNARLEVCGVPTTGLALRVQSPDGTSLFDINKADSGATEFLNTYYTGGSVGDFSFTNGDVRVLKGGAGHVDHLFLTNNNGADNDSAGIVFSQAPATHHYAGIRAIFTDVSANTEDSELAFYTSENGTYDEKVRIDEVGKVGIGTNDPKWSLDIETPDGGVQFQLGRTGSDSGSAWMGADVNGFHLGVGEYNNGGGTVGTPNGITVTDAGKLKLSAACSDVEAAIATNSAKVGISTAQASAITDNATAITTNATAITTNATAITANATAITTNASGITTNATAITDKVTYGGTSNPVNSIDFTINGTTLEITTS